jgi:hypothetical protein
MPIRADTLGCVAPVRRAAAENDPISRNVHDNQI